MSHRPWDSDRLGHYKTPLSVKAWSFFLWQNWNVNYTWMIACERLLEPCDIFTTFTHINKRRFTIGETRCLFVGGFNEASAGWGGGGGSRLPTRGGVLSPRSPRDGAGPNSQSPQLKQAAQQTSSAACRKPRCRTMKRVGFMKAWTQATWSVICKKAHLESNEFPRGIGFCWTELFLTKLEFIGTASKLPGLSCL